jgi:hypothetical protein
LIELLLRYTPQIVHFSGHGSESGALVFENLKGKAEEVPPPALTELFRIINNNKNIRCVFLNACYSELQADAISKHVESVIGMSRAISDNAAREFAVQFYQSLGFGTCLQEAFDLGIVRLKFLSVSDEHIPILRYNQDVDPSKLFILDEKNRNEIKNTKEVSEIFLSQRPGEPTSTSNFYDWTRWIPQGLFQ